MKPSASLASLALALGLAVAAIGCGGEEEESGGAQFPQAPLGSDERTPTKMVSSGGSLDGPGEAPAQIDVAPAAMQPPAPPPPPSSAPPQEIVAGSTTEEEYEARAADPNFAGGPGGDEESDYADTDPSALTDFRQALDPYGSWVDDPTYGTVWTPSESVVGDDFAPYVSEGQWTYDDANNWVWVSNYDWGWAPFHYGRWAYLGTRWGWIPGRRYAGAWVTWRTGYGPWDGYLGWAPLPPQWGWRNGSSFGYGFASRPPFVFCNGRDVFGPSPGSHVVTGPQVAAAGSSSRVYASPTAGSGGRVLAQPTVGPPPSAVGISPNAVAHLPASDRGLMHAQMFAHPATAQALGAHAAVASAPSYVSRTSPYSHGGLGAAAYSRMEPIARAPQYRGIAPTPYRYPSRSLGFPSRSLGTLPSYGGYGGYGAVPHYGSTYSPGRYGAPGYPGAAYGGYHGVVTAHPSNGHHGPSPEESPYGHGGGGGGGGFRGGGRGGGGRGGGGHR